MHYRQATRTEMKAITDQLEQPLTHFSVTLEFQRPDQEVISCACHLSEDTVVFAAFYNDGEPIHGAPKFYATRLEATQPLVDQQIKDIRRSLH